MIQKKTFYFFIYSGRESQSADWRKSKPPFYVIFIFGGVKTKEKKRILYQNNFRRCLIILRNENENENGMQGNGNRNEYCIDFVWLTQYNK